MSTLTRPQRPFAKRFADRIETMTADSVFDRLARSGLGGALQAVP